MEIINKKIEELKPYENNPRMNDDAVKYVVKSIQDFGFKVPIIIDKNNEIVAGHTRYKASLKLGLKQVPCIVADDLTEEQIKAFRIIDNKVGDFSLWDYEKLKIELDEIKSFSKDDIDIDFYGFDEFSVYDVLDETGLSKNEVKESDDFSITFSIKNELKPFFDNYLRTHTKDELNAIFLNVIKGMMNNED